MNKINLSELWVIYLLQKTLTEDTFRSSLVQTQVILGHIWHSCKKAAEYSKMQHKKWQEQAFPVFPKENSSLFKLYGNIPIAVEHLFQNNSLTGIWILIRKLYAYNQSMLDLIRYR